MIVRGAKVCNSMAPYADEIVALPTRFMGPKEAEYAVAFSLPGDWEGIKLMALPGLRHRRQKLTSPDNQVGDVESLTIFDDVFVPNERLFMNGLSIQTSYSTAGYLALMFAHFHRHSYTGCKTAVSEVIASQAALVADLNGITRYPHAEKISHIIGNAELVFAAGQRSAHRATKSPTVLTCRTRSLPTPPSSRRARDLSRVRVAGRPHRRHLRLLPTEESFYDPETADLMAKYTRNPKYTAEEAHRIFRMMEDKLWRLVLRRADGSRFTAGIMMETITMMARYDLEPSSRSPATWPASIPTSERYERPNATPRAMLDKFRKTVAEQKEDTCKN